MTRDEVVAVIQQVDTRVEALRPRLEQHAETAIPGGEWRVRDALSHLAARSNPVPNLLRRLEALAAPGGEPPRPPINDVNAGQVQERSGRSVVEILDEMRDGHRAAIESLPADDVLQRTMPAFGGGEVTVAEMIARSGARHENNHLDEIEANLP